MPGRGSFVRWWKWGSCTIEVTCGGEQHRVRPIDLRNVVLVEHEPDDAILVALGAPLSPCARVAEVWRSVAPLGAPRHLAIRSLSEAVDGREVRVRSVWRFAGLPVKSLVSVTGARS